MRFQAGVMCLFTVAWIAGAHASGTEVLEFGAHVTKVDPKTRRATIDRGRRAGLAIGSAGEVFAVRSPEGRSWKQIFLDERVAYAKVVELNDNQAVVSLDSVTDRVMVGAYFSYAHSVPTELAESSLFRASAHGIEMASERGNALFITVEAMLGDPSPALRDKALDTMIAELKSIREYFVGQEPDLIESGVYRGKKIGQVVDALDRNQLLEFFGFIDSRLSFHPSREFLSEQYQAWVMFGTPSGEAARKLQLAKPTIVAARAAAAIGKLDEARTLWRKALVQVPAQQEASAAVQRISQIQALQRQTTSDPDDAAARFQLMDELHSLGAYELALKEYPALKRAKYRPFEVERLRSFTLMSLKMWQQAEAAFKRVSADRPDDSTLARWAKYCHAMGKLAKVPRDVPALMALADVANEAAAWDDALTAYRKVIDAEHATARQRDAAKLAMAESILRRNIATTAAQAMAFIRSHSIASARDRVRVALRDAAKLTSPEDAHGFLSDLAAVAREINEPDFAIELLEREATLSHDRRIVYVELASVLLDQDRPDAAETAAKAALARKGTSTELAQLILGLVALHRGDVAAMEKHARAAAKTPGSPWPYLLLARSAAATGDWQQAVEHAREALSGVDDEAKRTTHVAVTRGLQAHEALLASPTSARERLRLVRALADLSLVKQATDEIGKLPADGHWRADAWWATAMSTDRWVPLTERLTAARNSRPTAEYRKRALALLEARVQQRAAPTDEAKRITLAKLYLREGLYQAALSTLSPILASSGVAEIVRDAADGLTMDDRHEQAIAATGRGDHEAAITLELEVQAFSDRVGATAGQVSSRITRAVALAALGRYPEATTALEQARSVAAARGNPADIAEVDEQLGAVRSAQGTNEPLRKALADGLKLRDELDNEMDLFWTHVKSVGLAIDDGRSADAIEHARKAWNLADRVARPDLGRHARGLLANANLVANRYGDAEQVARKLLVDCRSHADVAIEHGTLLMLGIIANHRGQGSVARAVYKDVYDLGARLGNTAWRADARLHEARSWTNEDPKKAAVAYEQAADLYQGLGAESARGSTLSSLAMTRLAIGQFPEARKAADEALAIAQRFSQRTSLAYAQLNVARIALAETKADEAIKYAKEAVSTATQTDQALLLGRAWHVLARGYVLKKQDQDALDSFEKALEQLSRAIGVVGGEADREGQMNSTRALYEQAIEHFLAMGKTARAMEILELARDVALKQTFDPTSVQVRDAKTRARIETFDQTRARVKGLEKQLDAAKNNTAGKRSAAQVKALGEQVAKTRKELTEIALDLKVTHRHLYRALAMDPEHLIDRRGELPAGSVLVEYFIADDALYAFVISAALAQPAVVRVKVTSAELATVVGDFRAAINREDERIKAGGRVEELGRKLDDWLLEPLRTHLVGATTVILVPFGSLYYVPFDALVVSEPGMPVRYAIEDFRISIQTATTLDHLLAAPRTRRTGTMLAIANPDGSLPAAQREVGRIVRTMPDARVLSRKEATMKQFGSLVGGYRYVHIATHGALDTDPRKSYLMFADGSLSVKDIAKLEGLDQTNELVVLSACETASEKGDTASDELVSLAVAFAMAGAPALVASLWKVGDESTAELMATFYRTLESGSGDRLDALRSAKLNLLRAARGKATPYAAPWHWASFQMFGDFRAPVTK